MIVVIALQAVMVIFAMLAIGYGFTAKGILPLDMTRKMSVVTSTVLAPCMLFNSIYSRLTPEMLETALPAFLASFLSVGLLFILAEGIGRLIKLPVNRRGNFRTHAAASNAMFIGLPVCLALFGEEGLPAIMFFFLGCTVLFWSVGNYSIRRDGQQYARFWSADTLKGMISPGLIFVLAGVVVVALAVRLPLFLEGALALMGNAGGSLTVVLGGVILYRMGMFRGRLRYEKGLLSVIFCRFLLGPALVWGAALLFGLNTMYTKIYILQMAMPAVSQGYVFSERYGADGNYSALLFSVTTLLSIVVIPLYMLLFTFF
ncbi:MAG: AEC family transporter [Christensenellales bacterium]|jgi:predicted permease